MKKAVVFAASVFFFAAAGTARAQEPSDSLIRDNITEAVVSSALTPPNAPFAVSRIGKEELEEFSGSVKELPYLFARTPGVVAWGDNGLGTGTTYLRIRGSGDSRINVTLDGVPLNSPEDQCVFWANMNSYSSFLEGVRIQRGVGSSSNGDGAFGGTVALTLRRPSAERMLQTDFSYGSYNSARAGFSFSSGLIGGKWTAEAAFHHSHTDGYVHGTRGNSGSWIASVYYFASPKLTIKYRNIGNYERTGQAWNGVETGDRFYGNYGLDSGVRGYEDLLSEGLGLYNGLCESWSPRISGGYSFNPYPQITTDNFVQDHNLLGADYDAGAGWKLQGTLHYTYGYGYYSNFQKDKKLSKYGFSPFTGSDGAEVSKSDFVRKKGISQNAVGLVVNARKSWEKVDLYLGSSSQGFFADHFGYLTYIGNDDLKREYT
ncbi:MAG: TonB-dependent receptor plug domain-containing protein, partial [Bacteroidales bacterium]|nr:TonB-dependent receptor plug domain-containing protein [Bacteroidales bacterium]